MPITDVQIINMALSHLGHTVFIDDRTEDSQEVAVSNIHYDQAISYTLEDFSWGFARAYDTLGLVEEEPNDDWRFAYRYPVDRVKVRRIVTALGRQDPNPPPFVIGSDDTGRLVYTDQEEAVVETTKLIEDAALFPSQFAEAVSWWLAFLMVPGLAKEPKIAGDCFRVYTQLVTQAQASDGNESQRHPDYESEAIRARG